MMNATMSITSKTSKKDNNISELSSYQVANNISFVGDKNVGSVLFKIINFGECNSKSVMKLLHRFDLPSKTNIKNVCFTVDMGILQVGKSRYVIEGIEDQLNDVQNHLYIDNPYLGAKQISIEFDLVLNDESFIVSSYKVFFNNEFIIESEFNIESKEVSIKHLNYLHPLLVDEYHNEWLDFEFEDNTPLHTSLMDEAIKRQLNFNFNNEFGTFEEQFEDGGFRSKLDLYLRDKNIKFCNTNFAIPSLNQSVGVCSIYELDSHLNVNKHVLTQVLSSIMVTPLDNLNWVLNPYLNEQLSA